MRRYILGPIITCLLVIGFIGIDFGLLAQAEAKAAIKKEAVTVASKDVRSKQKISISKQADVKKKKVAAVKKKKNAAVKKKAKNRHASTDGQKQINKKGSKKRDLKTAKSRNKAQDTKLKAVKRHRQDPHGKIAKNSRKSRHKAHQRKLAKVSSHVRPVSDITLPSPQTSDLWLAKESPEIYRQFALENKPGILTKKILDSAYSCIGVPYRHGGTTLEGFDCSGFVRYIFRENGIHLGRSSRDQAQDGRPVQLSELRPGDLIFFKMRQRRNAPSRIDHVGLYLGNGQFIHASNNPRMRKIRVDDLHAEHYLPKVVGARRVLELDQSEGEDTGSN